jgi:hypothetical protein
MQRSQVTISPFRIVPMSLAIDFVSFVSRCTGAGPTMLDEPLPRPFTRRCEPLGFYSSSREMIAAARSWPPPAGVSPAPDYVDPLDPSISISA